MWDEVRTAAEVVRLGTVSAAAEALGIHRSTINRRIDALEAHLGGKLFQRHKRGYTPTELGQDLLQIADEAGDRLEGLRLRAISKQAAVNGDLIITSSEGMAPLLMPKIAEFSELYPNVDLKFHASHALLKLELAEAHVAFRAGPRPEEPDYVVMPSEPLHASLFASKSYIARFGAPTLSNLSDHRFVLPDHVPPPKIWLEELVDKPNVVLTADTAMVAISAIRAGLGIGFLPIEYASDSPNLINVVQPSPGWQVTSWIVTHMDLHRTPKVQAFLEYFRQK